MLFVTLAVHMACEQFEYIHDQSSERAESRKESRTKVALAIRELSFFSSRGGGGRRGIKIFSSTASKKKGTSTFDAVTRTALHFLRADQGYLSCYFYLKIFNQSS